MSIYSGFATRQQEEAYDENIATLLYLLQKRVYKFYNNEPANDAKFIDLLMKVYATVKGMEDSKYLEPKLSPAMGQLIVYLRGKREVMSCVGENSQLLGIKTKQKQTNSTNKKAGSNSNIQLQSQPKPPQKLAITQRPLAPPLEPKPLTQQKLVHNSSIRKRINSNAHHRSVIISANSHPQLDSNHKLNSLQRTVVYETPKAKDGETGGKRDRAGEREREKEKEKEREKMEKVESREDVREMIKGYLVKRKKQTGRELELRRQQISQIFREL